MHYGKILSFLILGCFLAFFQSPLLAFVKGPAFGGGDDSGKGDTPHIFTNGYFGAKSVVHSIIPMARPTVIDEDPIRKFGLQTFKQSAGEMYSLVTIPRGELLAGSNLYYAHIVNLASAILNGGPPEKNIPFGEWRTADPRLLLGPWFSDAPRDGRPFGFWLYVLNTLRFFKSPSQPQQFDNFELAVLEFDLTFWTLADQGDAYGRGRNHPRYILGKMLELGKYRPFLLTGLLARFLQARRAYYGVATNNTMPATPIGFPLELMRLVESHIRGHHQLWGDRLYHDDTWIDPKDPYGRHTPEREELIAAMKRLRTMTESADDSVPPIFTRNINMVVYTLQTYEAQIKDIFSRIGASCAAVLDRRGKSFKSGHSAFE